MPNENNSIVKDIGGYQALAPYPNGELYADLLKLNLGRSALRYLIKAKNISTLYMPYFMCQAVIKACEQEKCTLKFYHIDDNFRPIFHEKLEDNAFFYIANFYGQLPTMYIEELKEKYGRIILDNAQAFFEKPLKNVDTIYTCRKFFPVADGGYLSTDAILPVNETDKSSSRMSHILKRCEDCASDHYQEFLDVENQFEQDGILRMSKLTEALMSSFNYDFVRIRREINFDYLNKALAPFNLISLQRAFGPYCYPFRTKKAAIIKKFLLEQKIYVPVLWPNVLNLPSAYNEYALSSEILPLPCDQRYTEKDLDKIINICLSPLK